MGKSEEFDRDDDPGAKNVVTKTPLGLLPLLILGVAIFLIVAGLVWKWWN